MQGPEAMTAWASPDARLGWPHLVVFDTLGRMRKKREPVAIRIK
jgi:hypothetical protein